MARENRRREFLKAGIVSSMVGLAGCTGGNQDDGNGSDGGGGDGGNGNTTSTETVSRPALTPENPDNFELVPEQTWMAQARTQNPQSYEWGQLAMNQLKRLGFRFNWEVAPAGPWADRLYAREWDFAHLAWSSSPERIYPYYNLYFSFHSQFAEVGEGNFELWASEQYDEAVTNFIQSVDREESQKWAFECQAILGANEPVIFQFHPDALVAHSTQSFTNWTAMYGTFAYWNHNTLRNLEPKGQGADAVVYGTTREYDKFPNFFTVTGPDTLMAYNMFYDSLTYVDNEGNPYSMAAEEWEWVDDTTMEVTLREGMTFHDGEPVTTEDVKFTWDWLKEYGVPYLGSDISLYESSETMDELTMRINLVQPFSGFDLVPMFRVKILPKHLWDGKLEEHNVSHPSQLQVPGQVPAVGSGPFEFIEYESGSQLTLEKYQDHYWADQYPFSQLIKALYGNQSSLISDINQGNVTFAQFLTANHWERAKNTQAIEAVANPSLYTTGVWVQTDKPPWNDVLVRRALAHATNQEEILNIVYRGNGVPAKSPISPVNEYYYYEDTQGYSPNLSKARDLLAESGFRWNEDGHIMIPNDWEPNETYVEPEAEPVE